MAITPELLVPSTFQHYLLGLFAVANNFPASGPFLTLSQGLPSSRVRRVIGIRTFSSLLLGFSGLSMLNATDPGDSHEKNFDVSPMDVGQMTSSAIVPISLPLTTGAGTISTITVYAERKCPHPQPPHRTVRGHLDHGGADQGDGAVHPGDRCSVHRLRGQHHPQQGDVEDGRVGVDTAT